ncbi:MAG: T9SS C-terminal target domain-containing protein [Saprospirales bacterium]|nr:MAG: T9SS C-terminal target domain-containing protein [Saprospirales bacterium]
MRHLITLLIFSIGITSLAEAQWRVVHLNEGVHGRALNISFYDDHLGFALFNNSILLRTTDIGENWERISLPGNMELTDIHFVNEELFFLSARDSYSDYNTGFLMRSVDSGLNWELVHSQELPINNIWFFDEENGLIAGYNHIASTDNQGSTWSTVLNIPGGEFTYGSIRQLKFADENTGYAFGAGISDNPPSLSNAIYSTADGGNSWDFVGPINTAFGVTEAFELAGSEVLFAGVMNKRIYRSDDGGVSWQEHAYVESLGNPVSFEVVDMHFLSEEVGFMVGYTMHLLTNDDNYIGFFIGSTSDGGETLDEFSENGLGLQAIHFLNDSVGFVAGEYELIMKTEGGIGTELPSDYPHHLSTISSVTDLEPNTLDISLYPNPTSRKIELDLDVEPGQELKIQVFDVSGRLLKHTVKTWDGLSHSIDINGWNQGLYFLRLQMGNMEGTDFFIKK